MDAQSHNNQESPEQSQVEQSGRQEVQHFRDAVHEAHGAQATEQGASSVPQPDPTLQTPSNPSQPIVNDPSSSAASTAQASPIVHDWMPQIADDTDLIEKEWIDKAKEIVARTAHDPYLQNKEVNKLKAEYLKKRYNKVLKQSD